VLQISQLILTLVLLEN